MGIANFAAFSKIANKALYSAGRRFSCYIIPYFCRKLGKVSQKLLSAAVVIGALRVQEAMWLSIRWAPQFFVPNRSSRDYRLVCPSTSHTFVSWPCVLQGQTEFIITKHDYYPTVYIRSNCLFFAMSWFTELFHLSINLTTDWHYTMAWLPASLLKIHRRLSTCETTMRERFVYERRRYATMVKIRHGLATLNSNNSVVYGQKHECGYWFS